MYIFFHYIVAQEPYILSSKCVLKYLYLFDNGQCGFSIRFGLFEILRLIIGGLGQVIIFIIVLIILIDTVMWFGRVYLKDMIMMMLGFLY